MSATAAYRLEDVTQNYGGRAVLQIDRLEVAAGEVLGLLGPTGAGKSTLLRLLAGLEAPASGRLAYAGHRHDGQALSWKARRSVTLVFQRPLLLTGTVRANVEYGLWLRGLGRCAERVQAVLDRLGLSPLAGQRAQTLSGGEIQLVALARALVLEPRVLLLDEPTSHLDPARVALVEEVVGQFQQQHCATVVWATHNLFQARRVAQRAALLLDGRLVEVALTEEFFESPHDLRTATFVRGEMVY